MIAVLAATMAVVALACGGDAATPTSPPTATSPPPTATSPALTPALTATPVPDVAVDDDYINYLKNHPGYKSEWGEPRYGGIARFSNPFGLSNWHYSYMGWGGTGMGFGAFQANSSLLMMDPWGSNIDAPICDLCESYQVSADNKTYTFKLREGVKFHSDGYFKDKGAPAEAFGAELTCKDIKASHEWYANPPPEEKATFVKRFQAYWSHFDSVTCPDGPLGYTAVLNFTRYRNATLSWLGAGIPIWNMEYREWMDQEHPTIQSQALVEGFMIFHGTGPFVPFETDAETVFKLRRNVDYFKGGAPLLNGFEVFSIRDYNTKWASLITGKTTQAGYGSSGLTKAHVAEAQTRYSDVIELHIVPYNHIQVFMLNPLRPPYDDWKVRQAVNLFVDRQDWDMFMTVNDAKMSVPAYYFHPAVGWNIPEEEFSTFPGFNPATKDEDIAEANRILDEVFGEGLRPRADWFVIQTLSRREPALWGIDQFKKLLGWEFDVKNIDSYGAIASDCLYTIRTEASTIHANTISSAPGDAIIGLHSEWTSHRDCYIYGYKGVGRPSSEEIQKWDAVIEEIDTTLDDNRRAQLLRELELYMADERLIAATIGGMNSAWANRRDLKGVNYLDHANTVHHRLPERLWMVE